MSLVYTEITLKNTDDLALARRGYLAESECRQTVVQAMVDTGAWTLVIDEETSKKLGLRVIGNEPAELADGSVIYYDLVGPLEVQWKNRRTSCDALVMPNADDILLGAIPLEAMDLTVNPRTEEVYGAHGNEVVHKAKGGVKKA